MRSGDEVAIFVTRRQRTQVLIVHRSPIQGSYWHVVAGGVERGETAEHAAARELKEETGLDAPVVAPKEIVEYVYSLTEEPADRRAAYDPSVAEVTVTPEGRRLVRSAWAVVALNDPGSVLAAMRATSRTAFCVICPL